MSTTAGVFSETQLFNQVLRADEIMFDDRIKQQFIPKYDTLQALMGLQNARVFDAVSRSAKEFDVEIEWMNTCGIEVGDNEDCVIGGEEASTNVEVYTLDNVKTVNFTVNENSFKDNRFDKEEAIARLLLKADKELTEWFNNRAIAVLNLNLGTNAYDGGKGTVSGTDTYIEAPYWNADLMGYMSKVAILNRFTSASLISGNNLYDQAWLAQYNAGNADGKGNQAMFGALPIYFDLWHIDTVNDPYAVTYMVEQGSVAFAHRTIHPDAPEVVNGLFTRYKMPSRFMPGISYDVYYTPECDSDRVKHSWKVKLNADMFVNPVGCDETNKGILRFICGSES
jgi:hypothetical protein